MVAKILTVDDLIGIFFNQCLSLEIIASISNCTRIKQKNSIFSNFHLAVPCQEQLPDNLEYHVADKILISTKQRQPYGNDSQK